MANLLKLSALASLCFAMIVFGACGGGGGGGNYSGGANDCMRYKEAGNTSTSTSANNDAYNSCMKTHTGTTTNVNVQYTVTNGLTYYRTGTDTNWVLYTGTSTSTQ